MRILITGSTQGLGRGLADVLVAEGHHVVVHARDSERAAAVDDLRRAGHDVVVGDLSSRAGVDDVAAQVSALAPVDTVVHNAGVSATPARTLSTEGHPLAFAVNVLAPYVLTASLPRPGRLLVLTSGMHRGADTRLDDLDWQRRRWSGIAAYNESKLLATTFAFGLAHRWPEVLVHAVDPGWVPTRMGGPGAPDDLRTGVATQAWLAVTDDASRLPSGGYWFHRARSAADHATTDAGFQRRVFAELERLSGVAVG